METKKTQKIDVAYLLCQNYDASVEVFTQNRVAPSNIIFSRLEKNGLNLVRLF